MYYHWCTKDQRRVPGAQCVVALFLMQLLVLVLYLCLNTSDSRLLSSVRISHYMVKGQSHAPHSTVHNDKNNLTECTIRFEVTQFITARHGSEGSRRQYSISRRLLSSLNAYMF
jgi:hypothetical protein